ncbi:hypothetical protein QTH91_06640 [Variovorax dokdonensis]|uniref:Lipase modulator n=1 Tax=Variovorax dokdonensis TaxID=344883 RepID=A0ABT7N884_9BURK|nr:hypothetical protein [Variovorax dokdonensis]MDM0044153.1 hypothetical protein [Variovorax dokdonensis]
MKRKIALVSLALAGVAGIYLLVLEEPPAPPAGSPVAASVGPGETLASPGQAEVSSTGAVAPAAPRAAQAAKPPVKPELVIPGGQDTFYPNEQQKKELARAMSNSGASAQDMRLAEKTAAFIDYNARISKVLQKPDVPIAAEEFADLMAQTDQMANDRYLTLAETQAVKARLLGTQYSGADLQDKLADLNRDVIANRERLLAAGDPSRRPEMQALRAKKRRSGRKRTA